MAKESGNVERNWLIFDCIDFYLLFSTVSSWASLILSLSLSFLKIGKDLLSFDSWDFQSICHEHVSEAKTISNFTDFIFVINNKMIVQECGFKLGFNITLNEDKCTQCCKLWRLRLLFMAEWDWKESVVYNWTRDSKVQSSILPSFQLTLTMQLLIAGTPDPAAYLEKSRTQAPQDWSLNVCSMGVKTQKSPKILTHWKPSIFSGSQSCWSLSQLLFGKGEIQYILNRSLCFRATQPHPHIHTKRPYGISN